MCDMYYIPAADNFCGGLDGERSLGARRRKNDLSIHEIIIIFAAMRVSPSERRESAILRYGDIIR